MHPTRSNILDFMAFVPDVDQAKAILFIQSANSVNEAVDRYYEDPERYSNRRHSSTSNLIPSPTRSSVDSHNLSQAITTEVSTTEPPSYAPATTSHPPSSGSQTSARRSCVTTSSGASYSPHESALTKAATLRAQDEFEMQSMLHSVQLSCRIYNPEIEPEHETHLLCDCPVHKHWTKKFDRLAVLEMWSKAVTYAGEKPYHEFSHLRLSNNNPYTSILSPFTLASASINGVARPDPDFHHRFVRQTMDLDAALNEKAQAAVQSGEPSVNIWKLEELESLVSDMSLARRQSDHSDLISPKSSKRSSLRKAFSVRSSDERTALKIKKKLAGSFDLRNEILQEEQDRWKDEADRNLVSNYQERIGISHSVAALRTHQPIQYLYLLRAGYFEPIPIPWQSHTPNLLKFAIDSATGWRGLTPGWRGYKNTAEERLYWTLRHKSGDETTKKLGLFSELDLARERMALAVQPHPRYHSPDDVCHNQRPSQRYSKQIKSVLRARSSVEPSTDKTMILLDARGSMDSIPLKPNYKQYLITGFSRSDQPKHQALAKAVVRRFVQALGRHENKAQGYQLVTFNSQAQYIDIVNEWNTNEVWNSIAFGGPSRIMIGWQKIKEMHFQKHSETATYHSIYGWQAGPQTPNLRLVLIFGSEFNDMDEFELTLLNESWAYVTIFLIGVEDCPHHHRRAMRLQRMADFNPNVSFVEAQGLIPERFATHELLKCHLGQPISMAEFENLEQQPAELSSPLRLPHQRARSSQNHLEQLLAELPSPDTTIFPTDPPYPSTPGLYELPDDPRPVELPATESPAISQRPAMPVRPPPLPPQPAIDHPLDPPPPYMETE